MICSLIALLEMMMVYFKIKLNLLFFSILKLFLNAIESKTKAEKILNNDPIVIIDSQKDLSKDDVLSLKIFFNSLIICFIYIALG